MTDTEKEFNTKRQEVVAAIFKILIESGISTHCFSGILSAIGHDINQQRRENFDAQPFPVIARDVF